MSSSDPAVARIEAFFADRYGREALYLPSGRAALYLALRTWLAPGNRVLMSPVNDDVVFFLVLAAGLVPVIGPLDPATGNLDADAVPAELWPRLRAVLTTNLYGIPDRMDRLREHCGRHGTLIIEDACHALDSRHGGQRIGTFGVAAAFSLSKHLKMLGGVLLFGDDASRATLVRQSQALLEPRRLPRAASYLARPYLLDFANALHLRATLVRMRNAFGLGRAAHGGHRMPYRIEAVDAARSAPDPLAGFRRWLETDHVSWRMPAPRFYLRTVLDRLDRIEDHLERRRAGQRQLRALGCAPTRMAVSDDGALFRVPFFVHDRDRLRARFLAHGLAVNYIYDPPLDIYAHGNLAERLPSPPEALAWSRDVLPVDPLDAPRFVAALDRLGEPAPAWVSS